MIVLLIVFEITITEGRTIREANRLLRETEMSIKKRAAVVDPRSAPVPGVPAPTWFSAPSAATENTDTVSPRPMPRRWVAC